MPIHADKNLYPGINPHLNSRLQQHNGGWKGFHSKHITHLSDALESIVPSGRYYIAEEQSLQIGTYDSQTQTLLEQSQTVSDVAIYQRSTLSQNPLAGQSIQAASPTMMLPIVQYVEEDEYITSLVIYRIDEEEFPGTPVTRIELLSPANKPPGSHYKAYLSKRMQLLHSEINIVEIDYLHERRPIIPAIPSYPDRYEDALPYTIIVNDLREGFYKGTTLGYGFSVLDQIPALTVPLASTDSCVVDFGAIYQHTFESSQLFRRILVDYAQEPVNFEAYSPEDQQRIRNHMQQIAHDNT